MTRGIEENPAALCSSCLSPNSPGARFCHQCGITLSTLESTSKVEALRTSAAIGEESSIRDPFIGLTIEGKYRIDKVIGTGGMGVVYQAARLLIGDQVAVKILHTERVVDPHASERFSREARAAARLKHPNVVSIYDFGVTVDGLQYLVMELIEGKSLRATIRQQGPLTASMAAEITNQMCAALEEAHRQHIIHRDVKPDNIIINSGPAGLRVKVLDFGIAKLRDETGSHLTQTGNIMGTPHYMSPEQCLGEELDHRADIYSAGIVLFEMLCGRVPFDSSISTAVVIQHVNQPPPSLRELNPAVSPNLERSVLRALEKSREARPQTAVAFAREVAAALAEAPSKRWDHGSVAPAAVGVNDISIDDATVERPPASSRPRPTPVSTKDQVATVHLSTRPGSTGPSNLDPSTGQISEVSGIWRKAGFAPKYLIAAAGLILLIGLIGVISWLSFRESDSNRNSASVKIPGGTGSLAGDRSQREGGTERPRTPGASDAVPVGMVLIAGGEFRMGSNMGSDRDSKPPHMVPVKPFLLDIFEVTRQQYKDFIDDTKHAAPSTWTNGSFPSGTANHPVTGVNWDDAQAYASWAGKRLPTEAEWEFAARGKDGSTYPWGNSWKSNCANAGDEGKQRKGLDEVGQHKCDSPFGIQDLIGNAWEWTASDWGPYPGGNLVNPAKGNEKVIRGGSWETAPKFATGFFRSGLARIGDQAGYGETGFRCAQDAP